MAELKKGTLSLSRSADLKKTNDTPLSSRVKQSFSHGKSKVVTVEVKKKRPLAGISQHSKKTDVFYKNSGLTDQELESRIKAVQGALEEKELAEQRQKEAEAERKKLEEEEQQRRIAEEKEQQRILEEAAELEKTYTTVQTEDIEDFEDSKNIEKIDNEIPEVVEKPKAENNNPRAAYIKQENPHNKQYFRKGTSRKLSDFDNDDDDFQSNKSGGARKGPAIKKDIKELKGKYSAGAGRVSIYTAFDDEDRTRSLTSIRRAKQKNKFIPKMTSEIKVVKEVVLPETISVQELSNRMAVRTGEVIKALMKLGVMATANQTIDADTAELIILEFGHVAKRVSESDVEIGLKIEDSETDLLPRPPVVTVMGHVDHGKTSLLDALRKTNVAMKEDGGITQGIGAYQITINDGRKITFIDTPGHAAFTEMRSRGANVTDIAVLVVAGDDSVKEQTIESINHAKAAGVPIVVAINKMDKHGANADNVRKDLLNHDIIVEQYGGDVMDVEISAKSGLNLEKLKETILLQAEMLDLKANPNRPAEGVVIESKVEKGQGPVATVLIKKGTLRIGDIFVSGCVYGKVRAIKNDRKENLKELTPGTPGEIVGFNGTTIPGDDFIVVKDESKAKEVANYRDRKKREQAFVVSSHISVEQMFSQINSSEKMKILSVIVKADVQGSSEAICTSLNKLSTDEVSVKVIHSAIGEITENDVALARASNALIIGFNVRANAQARNQIAHDKIQVRYYSIIYDLTDDIKALLSGLLAPEVRERVIGSAEVRQTFDVSKLGRIAGCMVIDGMVKRNAKVRLLRNGKVIYTTEIKSLKRHKDDAKEVREGFECGICLENYNDIHVGDIIECFEMEEIERQL
ncbi:MAG: translation initiation factor IF-2 [Alphaproteobacteria bacterium]|nr:translation initiation factor IF-2 [Alphaproteobacteria bacterium]